MNIQPATAGVTLRQVWVDYQLARHLKADTVYGYHLRLKLVADWLDRPVASISKDEIEGRHRTLSEINGKRGSGQAQANQLMRILKALFNFAEHKYDLPAFKNPVARLSEVRAWNKVKRRRTVIHSTKLKPWFAAVSGLHNNVARDYFLFLLFTGVRKTEGAKLLWTDIDFVAGTAKFRDTKNGDDHALPLPLFILDMLRWRHLHSSKPFVFPGLSRAGYITHPDKSISQVIANSGVQFMLHDLRRTFITVADSLELDTSTIKALVNHRSNDVTEGYIIRDIERLRKPIEKIAAKILHLAAVGYNIQDAHSMGTYSRVAQW